MLERILHRVLEPLYTEKQRKIWDIIQSLEMKEIDGDKLPTDILILLSLPFMDDDNHNYPRFSYIYSDTTQKKFLAKARDKALLIDVEPQGDAVQFIDRNREMIKKEGRISFFSEERFQILTVDSLTNYREGGITSESFVISELL